MDEILKGMRVRDFFDIEAEVLYSRYKVIETLLPHPDRRGSVHTGEEGRYVESLVRDFLNRHLPRNVRAVSGFIVCPSTKTGASDLTRVLSNGDRQSTQLDIIVYDFSSFPVYEQFEEFCIVPPEGVVGIVSVKKTLYSREIAGELAALENASELCLKPGVRSPYTGIFAFSAENSICRSREGIIKKIITQSCNKRFNLMVNEVSVLNKFVVFKFRKEDSGREGHARYVDIICRGEDRAMGHIPLQRMLNSILSVYYDPSRQGGNAERPGFVSFRKGVFAGAPVLGFVPFAEDRMDSRNR